MRSLVENDTNGYCGAESSDFPAITVRRPGLEPHHFIVATFSDCRWILITLFSIHLDVLEFLVLLAKEKQESLYVRGH